MVTTTTYHPDLDRARPAVSPHAAATPTSGTWRPGSIAPTTGGTTGLFVDVCSMHGTDLTAGANEQTIKRPARHLGTRST